MVAKESLEMSSTDQLANGHAESQDDIKKAQTGNGIYWFTFGVIFLLVAACVISVSVIFTREDCNCEGDFEPIVGSPSEPPTTTPRFTSPQTEADICSLPVDPNNCGESLPRWRYDTETSSCVEFIYTGCPDNKNNFATEDDCQSICGDAGGLPPTCTQLQDTPLDTLDVSDIFGTSTTLLTVAPPSDRVGELRTNGALPTGHFACNQINHGPLSPIRQFPHSATMDEMGITYEAYTLERWTDPNRQDPFYELTPGKDGAPWDKIEELGAGMKQMVSAPDSLPFSIFSGLTGIRVSLEDNENDPIMTDFGEMYANFLYTDANGGTMELPLVRGSGMLTHLFTDAIPVLTPYCLRAINDEPTSFECPEEESVENAGSGYVEASCNASSESATFVLHLTKPIKDISDVQWVASESTEWDSDNGGFMTCDETCCELSSDGKTVTIHLEGAVSSVNYAINVINKYVVPQHDYSYYWYRNPLTVACTNSSDVVVSRGQRMPVWFYGTASVDSTMCQRDLVGGYEVTATLKLSSPANSLQEVQYLIADVNDEWNSVYSWNTCNANTCDLEDDGFTVVMTLSVNYTNVNFAANVIGQFVTESVPANWRRQPEKIYCPGGDPAPTPQPITLTDNRFIFELSEPLTIEGVTDSTRKYAVFFSERMTMTFDVNGASFVPARPLVDKFTGIMQLVYAGSGTPGNFTWVDKLADFAGVYSYKPKTRFCTEGDKGYISFDWNKKGDDFLETNPNLDLLTVVLPHQEPLLGDNLVETPFGYKGYVGDNWVMEEDLPPASMEPNMDAVERIKGQPDKLQNVLQAIEKDTAQQTLELDCTTASIHSYEAGKSIGMVARLASISRAFGTEDYIELDQSLRRCLDLWLGIVGGIAEDNVIRYDTVWGGLWMRGAGPDEELFPWTNYGFISYADHHYHFGYWLYAIAYYAKYYPVWAFKEDNYNRIMAMARDVGSPSKDDPYFPTVRQKDWYTGSSWATGIGGGTRQQEAIAEAINCYHALAALGLAMNDTNLQAIGQITTATEIRAAKTYWQVRENNRHLFPSLIQRWGVIGQLQEDGIFYYTLNWPCEPDQFPQRHACIVGIQIIPIISISYLYMDQEWAESVYDVCSHSIDPSSAPGGGMVDSDWYTLDPVTTRFGSFCQSIMAKVNETTKQEAIDYITNLETTDLEPGSGLASTLLFIYESA
ncbi:uncharacterized protein LOC121410825 [Lytechinus variegatus]|uniref:uncharacterized protein LOC121410825 n=1 Tax=Lytechinus variegatus TaxID=7654 RepID=UPI001BB14CD1|nr:uncharacterized protein LOC121410825 [Lytechinus variegatus]